MSSLQRVLVVVGLAIAAVGLAWPLLAKMGLGRLPGDILIRRGGFTFYAPLATCIVVSVVISLILWLVRR